ncbi:MAG: amidohydrolase family protein [candidate division KSB1 bacterium]|nr:amidohydrolase family protein [candidate division KSB1 bacterium]MDZ7366048.1 amidohydrolase family protein [candidate division KSB1 bacterium]MDZ7404165.1 amidohydrolase family protein [candidate division KSB1 bacterium]
MPNKIYFLAVFVSTALSLNWSSRPTQQDRKQKSNPAGIWGEHRIIDIHAHIGSYKGYDLSTPTLMSNIERYGIRLALISNIDGAQLPETLNLDEIKANQATLDHVREYPGKLRGLVWTRPEDGSPEKVEPFLRETISAGPDQRVFVGMKFHPDMNHFPADDPRVDGYLQLCEKYQIPAVFHSGSDDSSNSAPHKIYAAARRHPAVPIILYHMGFLGPHGSAIATVKEALTKNDAQLYLETSQADPSAVMQAIKALGSERVLFGTDATYYGKEHYEKYEVMMARLKNKLSAEDFAKVVRGNAERLFRLRQ